MDSGAAPKSTTKPASTSSLEFYNLSHRWGHGMPEWPSSAILNVRTVNFHAKEGVRVNEIETTMHRGTHMDAPVHVEENTPTLTSYPLWRFFGTGVAVSIPGGLITPIIRSAQSKKLTDISNEMRDLAGRARNKKLKPSEYEGGTTAVSNLGMFGIDEFAAVINPPEGAILAVGRVREDPVVRNGVVSAGKRLAMTLSCDHRVIDGAAAARFNAYLGQILGDGREYLASAWWIHASSSGRPPGPGRRFRPPG